MNTTQTSGHRPSRGDRVGIYIFMVAGLAIIAWSLVATVARIFQLLLGENIQAAVSLVDTTVQVPVDGTSVTIPMEIDTAFVTATHLTSMAFGAAVIAAVLGFLTIATIVICLLLLARNSLRGKVFSRGNTRLVITAGMTALLGFGLIPVFEGMVGDDIVHTLSGGNFTGSALFVAEPLPFILLAFAFGIVATAYTIGARMQRDQEGLV